MGGFTAFYGSISIVCKSRKCSEFVSFFFNSFFFLINDIYYSFVIALEPRTLTRWDVHKYARRAYDMGVRYIGGCCGFEPYHIRAIAEEVGLMKMKHSPNVAFSASGKGR